MADPVAELRSAVEAAASSLRDGAERRRLAADPGAPAEARVRRLLDQRGDAAGAGARASSRGGPPRSSPSSSAGAWRGRSRRSRSRARASSTSSSRMTGTGARPASSPRRATTSAAGGSAEATRADQRRVRLGQPDRPVTAAEGRRAAFGDSIARILEFTGHPVTREYYVNDRGRQIDRFAASIARPDEGRARPEDGYEGEYVIELAEILEQEGINPDDLDALARRGIAMVSSAAEETLRRYGVVFDTWSSERALHESGAVERALEQLARAATSTRARARPGCGRRASATTRTAS